MARDAELIRIVDAALAEAVRKSGAWLACRPGCAECCIGPFPVSPLDARRLRDGLRSVDPAIAARILERARDSVARLERNYPGDTVARVIAEDEAGMDEPCPALDPETRTCDLYQWRPITCRTFGPPMRMGGESLAICELCFDGATPEEVEACEVEIEPRVIEAALAADGESETLVAYALLCST
jgi:Fe-S-cluster containining protein